jgi:predicted RNase H-like HicB family nuclease
MAHYVGVVDGSGEAWGVRFPDCPGAYGGGTSPDAAIADATSALAAWCSEILKDGAALPAPRTMADILGDPEARPDVEQGETAVLVPLLIDSGRSVKATLSVDAAVLETIDAEARRRGLTRSGFLVSAARDKIIRAR